MNTHDAERSFVTEGAPLTGETAIDQGVHQLLHERYGDGLIYLHGAAVRLGLAGAEGYLTSIGRSLVSPNRC